MSDVTYFGGLCPECGLSVIYNTKKDTFECPDDPGHFSKSGEEISNG